MPPPIGPCRPWTVSELSPSSQTMRLAARPAATAARRSHSLTRSSSRPRITVVPCAKAAATASTGYSSIIEGARSDGTSIPVSRECFARMSPSCSPPVSRMFSMVRSAPISCSVLKRPVRCSLSRTSATVTSDPGVISAATIGKAADDGSHGTVISCGASVAGPVSEMTRAPSASISTEMSAPKPASMRSVWSRVATGSITVVCPGVLRPARSTADFTCAEGTGTR